MNSSLISIDPFSSLPPSMATPPQSQSNSLFLPTLSMDYGPSSMPSSPFRLAKPRPEIDRLRSVVRRTSSLRLDLPEDQEALSAKKCRQNDWHTRVWLNNDRRISVQLCHVCRLNCQRNYRHDISKHFVGRMRSRGSHSNKPSTTSSAIIWYRYFAR